MTFTSTFSLRQWLAILTTLLCSALNPAQAAITCSINAPAALNFVYVSGTDATSPNNKIQSAITAICQRNRRNDPTIAVITLQAGDGGQPVNSTNQALFSGSRISYDTWQNAACTAQFDTNATPIEASFSSTTLSPETITFNYWGCIPAQGVASFPAGVYVDSFTLTLREGNKRLANSAVTVNITAPAKCTITGGPGNITFDYTAFGPANFQFTNFTANCTNSLPYNMDLSPVAGVVGGLRYVLGLADVAGSAGNLGPTTLSRVGSVTGSRSHVINGSMLANQAGQLGAIVPQLHTLTITY